MKRLFLLFIVFSLVFFQAFATQKGSNDLQGTDLEKYAPLKNVIQSLKSLAKELLEMSMLLKIQAAFYLP